MTKLILIQAVAGALGGRFFRLGRCFTTEGSVHSVDEFSESELETLASTSMLRISAAPDGEAPEAEAETVALLIKRALSELEASDFGEDGRPKLAAVKKALPAGTKGVTADLVATIWAELKPTT